MPDEQTKNLNEMTLAELKDLAKAKEIKNCSKMNKEELISELKKTE